MRRRTSFVRLLLCADALASRPALVALWSGLAARLPGVATTTSDPETATTTTTTTNEDSTTTTTTTFARVRDLVDPSPETATTSDDACAARDESRRCAANDGRAFGARGGGGVETTDPPFAPLVDRRRSSSSDDGGGVPRRRKKKRRKRRSSKSSSSSSSSSGAKGASERRSEETKIIRSISAVVPGYGKVEGRREGGVDVWRGIPYAAPPVGVLRFAPPEPVQPWMPAKLDASRYGPDCWQSVDPVLNPGADLNKMSEDCLYLNVFTPAGHAARSRQGKFLSGVKLLPVMVWFHGGAFQQGGARRAEYDGTRLAERDIVVVTINYRLGALGFLVSSRDGIFGNFGLMDQRAALDWIHDNIRAFGGDPDNVTLFGESAGAVMIGLHLMMEGAGTLFHRAIMQSNPMGYVFRSVVVADFIGEALKRGVDCRDLACLRAERVEEIIAAQGSFMGVPRSVGDFFTWGPTLTKEVKLKLTLSSDGRLLRRSEEHRLPRLDATSSRHHQQWISEWRHGDEITTDSARWSAVNVSQPLKGVHRVVPNIPVLVGSNKHEGEIFVHGAFPAPMPKAVYWMFVGALFRDSSSKVLKHYRGLVEEVEREAEEVARRQLEEEESKQEYIENREELEKEYNILLQMNATRQKEQTTKDDNEGLRALVDTWAKGGHIDDPSDDSFQEEHTKKTFAAILKNKKRDVKSLLDGIDMSQLSRTDRTTLKNELKLARKIAWRKAKALKEAAKVVVDYRPVMSKIIDDYLFRCPAWNYAQLLSDDRERKGRKENNVYVYRFSQPTHIPGYKECWGKSCHTAELPYVFQSMDIIRSNYSTVGPYAQKEAPKPPEYPYTEIMAAYRGVFSSVENKNENGEVELESSNHDTILRGGFGGGTGSSANSASEKNHTAFERILDHFFGDYFTVDADEELASDMAERWASFAREGTPNYDASKTEWLPWRHRPKVSNDDDDEDNDVDADHHLTTGDPGGGDAINDDGDDDDIFWDDHDEYAFVEDETDYFASDVEEDGYVDLDDLGTTKEPRSVTDAQWRRRTLDALLLEVVEEDVFRTELRRSAPRRERSRSSGGNFLSKHVPWTTTEEKKRIPEIKRAAQKLLRFAQQIGVVGMGLPGDETTRELRFGDAEDDDFFPELLELSWPPEGRLVEKDCSCEMWDRIRYRY